MINRQSFDCEFKFASSEDSEGVIEGYASMFGILDRGGDIVMPGAFKATLAAWKKAKKAPPMLWQHDGGSPIGVWSEFSEDEKGLKVSGQLIMEVGLASEARALVKAGAISGLSIGYETIDAEIDRATGIRRIKKANLWEVSLVTFPMLPEAQISSVKNFDARTLERALREELKLSQADAVSAVALFKKHHREGDGTTGDATREGYSDLIMPLRKAIEALR